MIPDSIRRALRSVRFERAVWLLPVALLLHAAEESATLPAWLSAAAGVRMTPTHFAVNGAFLLAWTLLACAGCRFVPRLGAWLVLFFAGLLGFWNPIFHAVTTFWFLSYSPGLITGAVLFVPVHYWLDDLAFQQQRIGSGGRLTAFALSGLVHLWFGVQIFADERVPLDGIHRALGLG